MVRGPSILLPVLLCATLAGLIQRFLCARFQPAALLLTEPVFDCPVVGSGVFVTVTVISDRIDDFLVAMEDDVTSSRDSALDPGCLRFDLLRDREDPNTFVFYECYIDDTAAAHHKTTAHYNSWAEFKASGGVVSQSVAKVETASLPSWAFQGEASGSTAVGLALVVTLDIDPDRTDDFLTAMEDDVMGSRNKTLDPGCLRFDLLRDRDDPNRYYFYEAYTNDNALAYHKTTQHFQSWADFKASGGVLSQAVARLETLSIPGDWAFQG